MVEEQCKWEPRYFEYGCPESALKDDPDGYCILHSKNQGKDITQFKNKMEERVTRNNEICLVGCYFPKTFRGKYFKGLLFEKPVDFREATFSEDVDFSESTFSQIANFRGANFMQEVDFWSTRFQEVDFGEAMFLKVYFDEAEFLQDASFRWAQFAQVVNFSEATFYQTADFKWAKFCTARFQGTVFKKEVNFSWAECGEGVFFLPLGEGEKKKVVHFGSGVFFHYARFLGEVCFQDVDLSNCSFLHTNIDKVDFRNCGFREKPKCFPWYIFSRPRKNVLKNELEADEGEVEYEHVKRLYQGLKRNFEDKKNWNTAGDFHYGEMECRRKMNGWPWHYISLEGVYWLASGYGERPLKAFVVLLLLLFVFSLVYRWSEGDGLIASVWYSIDVVTFDRIERPDIESGEGKFFWLLELVLVPTQFALFALALRRKVKR